MNFDLSRLQDMPAEFLRLFKDVFGGHPRSYWIIFLAINLLLFILIVLFSFSTFLSLRDSAFLPLDVSAETRIKTVNRAILDSVSSALVEKKNKFDTSLSATMPPDPSF